MDREDVGKWLPLGLSFMGCVLAIWMMLHGHEISGTPTGYSDAGGLSYAGLENVCVGFVWMLCGFLLVLLAGQGLVAGIIVAFIPRERWVEHDLDAVPTSTEEVVSISEDDV